MASITGQTDLDLEMLLLGGFRFTVTAGPTLRRDKWHGGLFVQYVTSDEGDFVVERSGGSKVAGVVLFPSERYDPLIGGTFGPMYGSNDNWTSYQPGTGVGGQNGVSIISGGLIGFFKLYETIALSGGTRSGGPIVYHLHDKLRVSENGLLCNDSAAQLILAGVTDPLEVGIVSAVPSTRNKNRLGADIKY